MSKFDEGKDRRSRGAEFLSRVVWLERFVIDNCRRCRRDNYWPEGDNMGCCPHYLVALCYVYERFAIGRPGDICGSGDWDDEDEIVREAYECGFGDCEL